MWSPKSSKSWRLCNKALNEERMCMLRCRNGMQVWRLTLPCAAGAERCVCGNVRCLWCASVSNGQNIFWNSASLWNHHLHSTSSQPSTSLSASRCCWWESTGKKCQMPWEASFWADLAVLWQIIMRFYSFIFWQYLLQCFTQPSAIISKLCLGPEVLIYKISSAVLMVQYFNFNSKRTRSWISLLESNTADI